MNHTGPGHFLLKSLPGFSEIYVLCAHTITGYCFEKPELYHAKLAQVEEINLMLSNRLAGWGVDGFSERGVSDVSVFDKFTSVFSESLSVAQHTDIHPVSIVDTPECSVLEVLNPSLTTVMSVSLACCV